jgi:hypothetical protein
MFRWEYCRHFQVWSDYNPEDAVFSSETLVTLHQTTRRHIPEDRSLISDNGMYRNECRDSLSHARAIRRAATLPQAVRVCLQWARHLGTRCEGS